MFILFQILTKNNIYETNSHNFMCLLFIFRTSVWTIKLDGINDGINLFNALLPFGILQEQLEARIRTTSSSGGGAILTLGIPFLAMVDLHFMKREEI